jgi:hypothetical protein
VALLVVTREAQKTDEDLYPDSRSLSLTTAAPNFVGFFLE